MTERMKRFFEAAVKSEQSLETLKDLNRLPFAAQREQISALAAAVGITLTEDDFKQIDGAELTDEELEKTAGGGIENMSLDELMTLLMITTTEAEEERRKARQP